MPEKSARMSDYYPWRAKSLSPAIIVFSFFWCTTRLGGMIRRCVAAVSSKWWALAEAPRSAPPRRHPGAGRVPGESAWRPPSDPAHAPEAAGRPAAADCPERLPAGAGKAGRLIGQKKFGII